MAKQDQIGNWEMKKTWKERVETLESEMELLQNEIKKMKKNVSQRGADWEDIATTSLIIDYVAEARISTVW